MSDTPSRPSPRGPQSRFEPELEQRFRESRTAGLIAVNLNTFWSIAIIIVAFGLWDLYADPEHWRDAFRIRVIAALAVVATGLFQRLPGKARWMPFLSKVRLVVAVVTSLLAALMLDRGYGFGVAGTVAIILTGPYLAIDARDLLKTNAVVLLGVSAVLYSASLNFFDAIGTFVFVLLAQLVSLLLARVLEASNRRAFALELEMHRDARTDALTGLHNRRAIQERAVLELKRAERSGQPVSVLLCDIDRFKSINDRHGHEVGDAVLHAVGRVLKSAVREIDALGRWGGEEFIAVLANADAEQATEIAERMRTAVAAASFDVIPHGITVSLGVSTCAAVDGVAAAWAVLLKDADARLYRAKSEGRNRVVSG